MLKDCHRRGIFLNVRQKMKQFRDEGGGKTTQKFLFLCPEFLSLSANFRCFLCINAAFTYFLILQKRILISVEKKGKKFLQSRKGTEKKIARKKNRIAEKAFDEARLATGDKANGQRIKMQMQRLHSTHKPTIGLLPNIFYRHYPLDRSRMTFRSAP